MSETTPVVETVKTPKKKVTKPQKPAAHPTYSEMVQQAVSTLKERGGSSRQAILKYIMKNFNVGLDDKPVNSRLKLALRSGVTKGTLKQSKGTGASGSFKVGEVKAEKKPKKIVKKKPATKKPAAKKAKTPTKKAKTPKKEKKTDKPKKSKTPKKATTPKKAAKKPAAKKSAVKKPAAKKPAAKKPAAKKPATKKPAAKKPAAKK